MARYLYDKYTAVGGGKTYQLSPWTYSGTQNGFAFLGYESLAIDPISGNASFAYFAELSSSKPNVIIYDKKPDGTFIKRYNYTNEYCSVDVASVITVYANYSAGSLVQSGILAEDGTYPANGRHTDGYYYVRRSATAPTPVNFTAPSSVAAGKTITLNFAHGLDAEGEVMGTEWAYTFDGSIWTNGGTVAANVSSFQFTVPTNQPKVKFRLRTKDAQGLFSPYTESAYVAIVNNTAPVLVVNTSTNFVLSEKAGQNEIVLSGTVKDVDVSNTVTVKCQVNGGTIRNIESRLADGAAIPFSKKLVYRNKQLYDVDTSLTPDLAENVDHVLKIWAEDGAGGVSTIVELKFRVIHNRPPTISGADTDLGTLNQAPVISYTVTDAEGESVTVIEKINGQLIRSFSLSNLENTVTIPHEKWIELPLQQQHTLTIEAKDAAGLTSVRTYSFVRSEDKIIVELKQPFPTDIAAKRILVTPDLFAPAGAKVKIEACNNAFDTAPAWEDITSMALGKRGYSFTNTSKTGEKWGINIRFTIEKGTATQIKFNGFGGAFE